MLNKTIYNGTQRSETKSLDAHGLFGISYVPVPYYLRGVTERTRGDSKEEKEKKQFGKPNGGRNGSGGGEMGSTAGYDKIEFPLAGRKTKRREQRECLLRGIILYRPYPLLAR
ncbi:hypothetical protein WN55_04299 [Dufourea novaeangliae]|uniref:Uncharacterized protein n=1 Tax=Dufourea novaeangliae TaxID=178035 RepID=A0A154PLZ0_DUFNO|nr:hypothetical protein WN55_04299 [Dufourea novaeangliae]